MGFSGSGAGSSSLAALPFLGAAAFFDLLAGVFFSSPGAFGEVNFSLVLVLGVLEGCKNGRRLMPGQPGRIFWGTHLALAIRLGILLSLLRALLLRIFHVNIRVGTLALPLALLGFLRLGRGLGSFLGLALVDLLLQSSLVISQKRLEVFKVVALGGNLVSGDEWFGLALLRNVLAFGWVQGGQLSVGDPGTSEKQKASVLSSRPHKGVVDSKGVAITHNSLVSKNITGNVRSWVRLPPSTKSPL